MWDDEDKPKEGEAKFCKEPCTYETGKDSEGNPVYCGYPCSKKEHAYGSHRCVTHG